MVGERPVERSLAKLRRLRGATRMIGTPCCGRSIGQAGGRIKAGVRTASTRQALRRPACETVEKTPVGALGSRQTATLLTAAQTGRSRRFEGAVAGLAAERCAIGRGASVPAVPPTAPDGKQLMIAKRIRFARDRFPVRRFGRSPRAFSAGGRRSPTAGRANFMEVPRATGMRRFFGSAAFSRPSPASARAARCESGLTRVERRIAEKSVPDGRLSARTRCDSRAAAFERRRGDAARILEAGS